jgi:hypothetical protein
MAGKTEIGAPVSKPYFPENISRKTPLTDQVFGDNAILYRAVSGLDEIGLT